MYNAENFIKDGDGNAINFIPTRALSITENDSLEFIPGLLFVGTTGNVTVKPVGQTNWIVFKNIPSGSFLPVKIKAVHTDSTAADLVICY